MGAEVELVRAATLKGYFEVAKALKLDPSPLLRRLGLSASMFATAEQMLPARLVIRLLEESAEAADCPTFGLRMAEHRELADLGIVSLLIAHQPTLGAALSVLDHYRNRINSTVVLRIEKFDDVVLLREVFSLYPPMPSRQADDLVIGVINGIGRTMLGTGWQPISISFNYEPPPAPDRAVFHRVFACPLQFGSEFGGILIKAADLDRLCPRYEPALAHHARRLVEATVNPGERSIIEEVDEALLLLLPVGRASIGAIAESIGLSARTLQRRLDAEDARFGDLLDRVRVREVTRLFANRRLKLTDVAHLLGYASLAAFSRWYRDHFDETPSAGRRRGQNSAT